MTDTEGIGFGDAGKTTLLARVPWRLLRVLILIFGDPEKHLAVTTESFVRSSWIKSLFMGDLV
jgi:hypothetical protein